MCAQPDVRATFDRLAIEYDELKLRVIPGYRQVQDLAFRYASRQPCERVLELGCGTGEWASAFLRNHPAAEDVAIEFSPKMRDVASTLLSVTCARWLVPLRGHHGAPDPVLERSFLDGWVAFMQGAGLDPERIPHVLADHRENDLAEPASTQLSYLRAAGFAPAAVIWCQEKFAVFYAARPDADRRVNAPSTA